MSRQRKEISPQIQKIILTMLKVGDSDRRIYAVTKIKSTEWRRLADETPAFGALLEKAVDARAGGLGRTLRNAMIDQIRKGHPWWAKLAIHNYGTGLRDPDVVSGGKLKKMIDKIATASATKSDLLTTDPALATAQIPPGSVPGLGEPSEIQDDSRGETIRED